MSSWRWRWRLIRSASPRSGSACNRSACRCPCSTAPRGRAGSRTCSSAWPGVIAKAWLDPEFKGALLADATKAIAGLGLTSRVGDHLIAVENTSRLHNMVVCTLCSCYPWDVLGLPPVWYKSAPSRSRCIRDPRGVLADFGVTLPADTEIRVWDSTAETRFMVLPPRPAGTEGWNEERLASLVTRDCMIGTGLPRLPGESAS